MAEPSASTSPLLEEHSRQSASTHHAWQRSGQPTSHIHCCPASPQTDSSSSAATSTASPDSLMCWAQTAQSLAAPQATTMVSGLLRPTDSSLTSGETGIQTGRPSHTLAASHQPVWTDGLSQSSCDAGSAQPLTLLTRQQDTLEITRVSPSASQLQAAHTLAEQPGACRCTSSTMRASAQRWQTSSQHTSRTTHV